jgi:uncharacterized membrane protein HdeD (DUF308 family)
MNEDDGVDRSRKPWVAIAALIGIILLMNSRAFETDLSALFVIFLIGALVVAHSVFRKLTKPAIDLSILDVVIGAAVWRWWERRRSKVSGPRW